SRRPRLARAVEEPLEYGSGATRDAPVLVAQPGRRAVEAAGKATEDIRRGGQGVSRGAFHEKETVPGPLAEAVRLDESTRIFVLQRAGANKLLERVDRVRCSDAVLQLQKLRRPLDVRQRSAAEFEVELSVFMRGYPFALDARLH